MTVRLLLLAVVAGALGSLMRTAAEHVSGPAALRSRQRLRKTALDVMLGGYCGLIAAGIVASLMAPDSYSRYANPFGTAAVAAAAGLYARSVYEALLKASRTILTRQGS